MVGAPDGLHRHTPTLSSDIVLRVISLDSALSPHIGDSLANLTFLDEWFAVGDPVQDVVDAAKLVVEDYYNQMLIGMVTPFIVALPVGWLQMDGSTYLKVDYPELWELLPAGLKTGTNFTLPNLDDAFLAGAPNVAGIGVSGGFNSYSLTVGQMPAHTHNYTIPVLGVPAGPPPTNPTAIVGGSVPTSSVGSGDSIDNRPDFIKVLFGVFAGRA